MAQDVRELIPRVRRAVEGVAGPETLTDDQVKDLTADAIAEIILYTRGAFPHTLLVTDTANGAPTEYEVDPALSLPEETVVADQAALNHFFHAFQKALTSERIADEAHSWEWTRSAQLMTELWKQLVRERDQALEILTDEYGAALDAYASFLAVRDSYTAALIEPWTAGGALAGQELVDVRFGTLG
jgi:hypothetical protein